MRLKKSAPMISIIFMCLTFLYPSFASGINGIEKSFDIEKLFMAEHSVVIMTSAEVSKKKGACIQFSTLPGNTVAQFVLSCKCGVDTLSPKAKAAFKEAILKSVNAALAELHAARVGPGELFKNTLLKRAIEGVRRCRVGNAAFDLAGRSLQCQYQIQTVPDGRVGFNSAGAKGADIFVFVTVLFAPVK